VPDKPEQIDRLSIALTDRYRIERQLGVGGMATVYLAEDLKHHRKVALKVLRPELAAILGSERFLKEIEVTANLQHPNVLPLYDSGEADSFLYYVMPFVEGESLRDRLNREKQLSVEETVKLTESVAAALEYAHQHDVIHRDIKPENILLQAGQALVADFGIALAVRAAGGTRLTETGLSLGTPHYMSPEQATGDRELDARSDVYSLGAMVYEMLVGEPPHLGNSAQAIIAKILSEKPSPISQTREMVPGNVDAAVHKALAKSPADRFSSAADFVSALRDPSFAAPMAVPAPPPARRSLVTLPWVLVAALALIVGILAVASWQRSPADSTSLVQRLVIRLGPDDELAHVTLALSPGGEYLAFQGRRSGTSFMFLRPMAGLTAEPIPGSERAMLGPFFSPDGRWVGFGARAETSRPGLAKALTSGGHPLYIVDGVIPSKGGTWGSDGRIIFTPHPNRGLVRVSSDGGPAEELSFPDSTKREFGHWWPHLLPGERAVLFTAFTTPLDSSRIMALSLETGETAVVVDGGWFARYVSTGHLVYMRGETIMAAPFDPHRLATTGSAMPVVEGVAVRAGDGAGGFAISHKGTLAYVPATVDQPDARVVFVRRDGTETPLLDRPARYAHPALSPDGERLAVTVMASGVDWDVYVYDLVRGMSHRLTTHQQRALAPRWIPDGSRILYSLEDPAYDVYWRVADGSLLAEPLVADQADKHLGSVSPDGRVLVFTRSDGVKEDIWLMPLAGQGEPVEYLGSPYDERFPAFAPSGEWLAFQSNTSGTYEVYVQRYPGPEGRQIQVSVDGGREPHWTRGGRELVYRRGTAVMAVSFDPASGEPGTPEVLIDGPYQVSKADFSSYDVTPDGERFVMVRVPPESAPREITVVVNWFEELKATVGNE
jgi:serine/threonine-protein kinase